MNDNLTARSLRAAERTAAELALRRLHHERRAVEKSLRLYANLSYLDFMCDEGTRKANHQTSQFFARMNRQKSLSLSFVFFVLALVSGWAFLWILFATSLVFLLVFQVMVMRKLPILPIPTHVPCDEELRLGVELDRIEAEIARHRRTVGGR